MHRFKNGEAHVPIEVLNAGPHVEWKHIDGPLMTWAGELHWLTWRERLSIAIGFRTVRDVACARWPHLAKQHATYKRLGDLPVTMTVQVGGHGGAGNGT